MKKEVILSGNDEIVLLKNFNARNSRAFGNVYYLLYDEIFYFTSRLYRETEVVACDIIHDIFSYLWVNSHIKFENVLSIRSYLYISIRNGFKNYLAHKKCVDKYNCIVKYDDNKFIVNIAETHIFSILNEATSILPKDCAEVLKYHFEGWQMKDIAQKMDLSERSIYNKRDQAIEILKKSMSKDKFLLFLTIGSFPLS